MKPDGEDRVFRGPTYEDAVSALLRAIEGPAPVAVLTGETGTGKTTVLRGVASALQARGVPAAFFDDAASAAMTVRHVGDQLSGRVRDGAAEHAPVILVGAAERLSADVLGYFERLCALRISGARALRLVLAAGPGFAADLEAEGSAVRGLARFVGEHVVLRPMERREFYSYVEHACRRLAMPIGVSVSDQAVRFLSQYCEGNPRRAERLLRRALKLAARMRRERVTLQMIQQSAAAEGNASAAPAEDELAADQPPPAPETRPPPAAGPQPAGPHPAGPHPAGPPPAGPPAAGTPVAGLHSAPLERVLPPASAAKLQWDSLTVGLVGASVAVLAGAAMFILSLSPPERSPAPDFRALGRIAATPPAELADPKQPAPPADLKLAMNLRDPHDRGLDLPTGTITGPAPPSRTMPADPGPPSALPDEPPGSGNVADRLGIEPLPPRDPALLRPHEGIGAASASVPPHAADPAAPLANTAAPAAALPAPPAPKQLGSAEPGAVERHVPPAVIAKLLALGQRRLATGDISGARLLLVRAAEGGSAQAATLLGKTYDPAYLSQIAARGIAPDPGLAIFWYRRGMELGDRSAAEWLGQMPKGDAGG